MPTSNGRYLALATCMAFLLFSNMLSAGVDEGGADEKFHSSQSKLAVFDQSLSLHDLKLLKQTSDQDKASLNPHLRDLFDERQSFKEQFTFWDNVVRLKRDLMGLPGKDLASQEAEVIATTAIRAFGELREKYAMVRPAIFHNMLVNMGLKGEGLCWQWTRDLTKRLLKLDLKTYDIRWATARGGTMREHNTVVLVARGRDLSEGLFLDGWTHSGKPFWMRVKDDRKHPWKPGSYSGDDLNPE